MSSDQKQKLNLDRLREYRQEIFKAEIAALLFNLGKTDSEMYNKYRDREKQDSKSYKRYLEISKKDYPQITNTRLEKDLLNTNSCRVRKLFEDVKVEMVNFPRVNLYQIMCPYRHNKWNLILFRGCEQVNSGIDKGFTNTDSKLEKPWIANAFGSFREFVEEEMFDDSRRQFFQKLDHQLGVLTQDLDISNLPSENWWQIRQFIFHEIKNWYTHLLSDDRFPMNDVTLWDQAYMTSTLFKASLAALLLEEGLNYDSNPSGIKWSILGIQYDKLAMAEKSLRVQFIQWYRDAAAEIDQSVKTILEKEYALGNEIYRDETGIYFLVPENVKGDYADEDFYKLHSDLNELENKIVCEFMKKLKGEVYPSIFVTKPSRGTMNLVQLLHRARENLQKRFFSPKLYSVFTNSMKKTEGTNEVKTVRGLCQICRVRLASDKDKHDILLCEECQNRSSSRINEWLENADSRETIWTGEVQDRNGRIAFVTVKFELQEWLNGNQINTLLMNRPQKDTVENVVLGIVTDLKNRKEQNGKIKQLCQSTILKYYVDKSIKKRDIESYVNSVLLERTVGERWEKLLRSKLGKKVDFVNRTFHFNHFDNNDFHFLAKVLFQFLIRKNPSPARLRRVWESTGMFFEEMRRQLPTALQLPTWRCVRLMWNAPGKKYREGLYQFQSLDFWASGSKVFLITSIEKAIPVLVNYRNRRMKKGDDPEKLIRAIFDRFVSAENDPNFRQSLDEWLPESLEIVSVDRSGEKIELNRLKSKVYTEKYLPIFSITDPSPVSWQVAVPAEYAPNLVRFIQAEYRRYFKHVNGKLPLHIGLVVQQYKRPLYIGVKALRRIRRDIGNWKSIERIMDVHLFCKEYSQLPKPESEERKLEKHILYRVKASNVTQSAYSFYFPPYEQQEVLLTLEEISNNTNHAAESVILYPNTFDFEFLDVNTRRNDICYSVLDQSQKLSQIRPGNRLMFSKRNRPYTWSEWERFERFLEFFDRPKTKTKLRHLIELIYTKLDDWNNQHDSLKNFVSSALINVLDLQNEQKEKDYLAQIFGEESWSHLQALPADNWTERLYQFIDMFEFWHTALKRI
mgnify:CR=1 FL=1